MSKSSSLCLYSSNLGTFWLKIGQFWPFWEISIFSNGGHLGYRTALTDTILKGTTQGSFQQSLVEIGSVVSEEKIFFYFHPPFFLISIIGQNLQKFKVHKKSRNICQKAHHYSSTVQIWALSGLKQSSFGHLKKVLFLVMAAIFDIGRRWRTQFWKGSTQGSFQQSLVEIGSVVSEEKICFKIIPLFSNLHNRSKSVKVQSS